MDKRNLNLGTIEQFRHQIKKTPLDMVFAKSSSQNSKAKMLKRQKKDTKVSLLAPPSNKQWSRDKNVCVLATANLLSEVNDVIEEANEEEQLTTSRANFDFPGPGGPPENNSSVQLVEVGSSAEMSRQAPHRARQLLSPEIAISHNNSVSHNTSRGEIDVQRWGAGGEILTQRQSI